MSERTTAAPLPDDLGERIADWYAELTWRRGSTLVQPDDRTWVLLSPEWPRSYANNGILVRADPGGESLLAWGEELLGGAGLEHRHVFALCDLSEQTRAQFLGNRAPRRRLVWSAVRRFRSGRNVGLAAGS